MKIVDVRETPRTGDRQQVITRDNVAVIVNATIFSQVVDVRLALFTNSDYLVSVDNLARTSVRAVFGSITLDEAFSQRERIGTLLQTQMEEATDKWGVRINRVEVLEITPARADPPGHGPPEAGRPGEASADPRVRGPAAVGGQRRRRPAPGGDQGGRGRPAVRHPCAPRARARR